MSSFLLNEAAIVIVQGLATSLCWTHYINTLFIATSPCSRSNVRLSHGELPGIKQMNF
jgi:hypothetical protein